MAEKQMLKEMERKIKNLFLKIRLGALVQDRWPENSCLKKWRGGRGGDDGNVVLGRALLFGLFNSAYMIK